MHTQFNKVLKSLMLTLPIILITSCNSSKKNYHNESRDINMNDNYSNKDTLKNEQARLQIEPLHQNNIIYFRLDKYDIQPQFAEILDVHANFLRNNLSSKIIIEGHADERGTPEYNIALGERRAISVKIYLQGKGVSENQIAIVSYGKEKPAVLGHNEADYAKNRRAVLVY